MTKPARQIVFIAGSGHSGSTLLDMCLGGHPDIAALGETGFLYFYAHNMSSRDFCTCGETIEACPFWTKVTGELALLRDMKKEDVLQDFILSDPAQVRFDDAGHYQERLPSQHYINPSFIRPWLGLLGSGALFKFASRYSKVLETRLRAAGNRMLLFDAVLNIGEKSIALDSTKNPGSLKECWMLRSNIPVKFIAMHRDGRGVAASHARRLKITFPQAVRMWRNEIIKWWVVSLTIPKKDILTLHYESFTANPEAELRRVCDFLSIPYHDNMLDFRNSRHNIGGNMMRFRKDETKITLDERWRLDLDAQQLKSFAKIAGWVNRLLGYKA